LPASAELAALVGEYGSGADTIIVLERGGQLFVIHHATEVQITAKSFTRDSVGQPVALQLDAQRFPRRSVGTDEGITFRIVPAQPVDVLRRRALTETPPVESGHHRRSDLADVARLDHRIKLDIRYATANNFMGAPMYSSARAFLQRPAANALVRAHHALAAYGFGLLIHDAYRPWYVTRMFWDATTGAERGFVANPATGSKHNRGAAVDLTLYELATGTPVRMTGGYDEFSERSYAQYPGGTSRQRWTRDLLRRVMEHQGFTVNPSEWWHFDYENWRDYPLSNISFEAIDALRR
jgi:D-alanyl-D-alanine dipeptidase